MTHLYSYDKDVSFFHVDSHAQNMNTSEFSSLEEVITYLEEPIPANSKHRDLLLARAILIWIGNEHSNAESENTCYDSEVDIFIAETEIPHAFCELCKMAGIECEIVVGTLKALLYLVGDDDTILEDADWVHFKANDKWHVVIPQWVICSIIGYKSGGEISIEHDGVTDVQVEEQNAGTTVFHIDDFWFCTNPKYFVTRCRADDPEKQHITRPISLKEFLGIPDFEKGFFRARLRCLTENSCRLFTKNGKINITLLGQSQETRLLDFSYTLSMLGNDTEGLDETELPRLVMYYPSFERKEFTFEIRFPKVGAYIFRTYVEDLQTGDFIECCNFRITCEEVSPNIGTLPMMTGSEGWGYGSKAKDAGLLQPSNPRPKIAINLAESTENKEVIHIETITFKLDEHAMKETEYQSVICGDDGTKYDGLNIDTRVDTNNRCLEITSTIKAHGEYGLVVQAKDKNSPNDYEAVVNYLITTFEDKSELEDHDRNTAKRKKEFVRDEKVLEREEKKMKLAIEIKSLEHELEVIEMSAQLQNTTTKTSNKTTDTESSRSNDEISSPDEKQRQRTNIEVESNESSFPHIEVDSYLTKTLANESIKYTVKPNMDQMETSENDIKEQKKQPTSELDVEYIQSTRIQQQQQQYLTTNETNANEQCNNGESNQNKVVQDHDDKDNTQYQLKSYQDGVDVNNDKTIQRQNDDDENIRYDSVAGHNNDKGTNQSKSVPIQPDQASQNPNKIDKDKRTDEQHDSNNINNGDVNNDDVIFKKQEGESDNNEDTLAEKHQGNADSQQDTASTTKRLINTEQKTTELTNENQEREESYSEKQPRKQEREIEKEIQRLQDQLQSIRQSKAESTEDIDTQDQRLDLSKNEGKSLKLSRSKTCLLM